MPHPSVPQWHIQCHPRLSQLRVIINVRCSKGGQRLLPPRIPILCLIKLQSRQSPGIPQRHSRPRQRFHTRQQCLTTLQHGQSLNIKSLRNYHNLHGTTLRLAPLQIRRNQFRGNQIGGLHPLQGQVPIPLNSHFHPALFLQVNLLPRSVINLDRLHEVRQSNVVLRHRYHFH